MFGEEEMCLNNLNSLVMDNIEPLMEMFAHGFLVILQTKYDFVKAHQHVIVIAFFTCNIFFYCNFKLRSRFSESRGTMACSTSPLEKTCYTWA